MRMSGQCTMLYVRHSTSLASTGDARTLRVRGNRSGTQNGDGSKTCGVIAFTMNAASASTAYRLHCGHI